MALDIVIPPSAEPLALDEAKAWLRVDGSGEDALLVALVAASRVAVEAACGRLLLTQGWRLRLDAWPEHGPLRLPVSPVTAVTGVTVATAGGPVDVDPGDWVLATSRDPPRLVFLRPPPPPDPPAGGIAITGTAGLAGAPSALPEAVRQAVRLTLAALWENRGDAALPWAVPPAALALLHPFRRIRL